MHFVGKFKSFFMFFLYTPGPPFFMHIYPNPGLHQKSQTSNSNQISNRRISWFEISHFKPAFEYSAW